MIDKRIATILKKNVFEKLPYISYQLIDLCAHLADEIVKQRTKLGEFTKNYVKDMNERDSKGANVGVQIAEHYKNTETNGLEKRKQFEFKCKDFFSSYHITSHD